MLITIMIGVIKNRFRSTNLSFRWNEIVSFRLKTFITFSIHSKEIHPINLSEIVDWLIEIIMAKIRIIKGFRFGHTHTHTNSSSSNRYSWILILAEMMKSSTYDDDGDDLCGTQPNLGSSKIFSVIWWRASQ